MRTDNSTKRNRSVICITVDGLHSGFIGAYGNCSIRTPVLDELASESALFDRFYTDSLELSEIFSVFTDAEPISKFFLENGYRTILVTDDHEVAYHEFADGFSEHHLIDTPQLAEPVETVEQTQFFRILATAADLISASSNDSEQEKPYFLWVHLRGFGGVWDFPLELRENQMDEDDPTPYSGTVAPFYDYRGKSYDEIDPDEIDP
ncbi:MAG: hypothetical protein ACRC2T_16705, partial [Thermoguttaceae bacterium]